MVWETTTRSNAISLLTYSIISARMRIAWVYWILFHHFFNTLSEWIAFSVWWTRASNSVGVYTTLSSQATTLWAWINALIIIITNFITMAIRVQYAFWTTVRSASNIIFNACANGFVLIPNSTNTVWSTGCGWTRISRSFILNGSSINFKAPSERISRIARWTGAGYW